LTRKLIIPIDGELEKEMSKYPEVDWVDAVRKSLRECIRRKEIAEMYNAPVERAMLQEKQETI
jgi:hypothetical protein